MSRTPIHRNIQAEVFQRDGFRCRYCGSVDGPFELDHVYPEAKGGQTTADNLVVSCKACNRLKCDTVGMWPFPIGYFESSDKQIPEGEGRYWRLLQAACHEVTHAISSCKDAENRAIGDEDKTPFRRLITRLKSLRNDLTCIFPSVIKSIQLFITHQKPTAIDLVAAQIALETIIKDMKYAHDDTWTFVRPPLIQAVSSLNLAYSLLNQAQLSIPQRSYTENHKEAGQEV